jgi:hypothetical protein
MRVQFVSRDNGPDHLVCDAEVVFDEPGPFSNMKLMGFCLWRNQEGDLYVTFPSRAFGAGPERRYFDYLRSVDGNASDVKNVKSWILAQYHRQPAGGTAVVGGNAESSTPQSRRRKEA